MERTRLIEAYLDGSMPEKEREEFENLLAVDNSLRQEVALMKEVNEAISEEEIHEFREKVGNIMIARLNGLPAWIRIVRTLSKLPVAAAILVLIGLSLWRIFTTKSGPDYFNELYVPYQTDITTRSINSIDKNKIELSYLLYQEENYEASFEMLNNYLLKQPQDKTAQFYLGMDAIELKKYDVAIASLSKVANDSSSLYSLHARWYLALSYLEINNKERAKECLELLSSSENLYSSKSKKLLKKL